MSFPPLIYTSLLLLTTTDNTTSTILYIIYYIYALITPSFLYLILPSTQILLISSDEGIQLGEFGLLIGGADGEIHHVPLTISVRENTQGSGLLFNHSQVQLGLKLVGLDRINNHLSRGYWAHSFCSGIYPFLIHNMTLEYFFFYQKKQKDVRISFN